MLSIYRDGARDPFAFYSLYDSHNNRDNDRVINLHPEESDNVKALELVEFDALEWLKNISSSAWIRFVFLLVIVSLIGFAATAQALVLRRGSRGPSVVALQNRLREAGYFYTNTTGYYGSRTERAVRNYQRDRDLLMDGIAGPQTLTDMGLSNVGGELPIIGYGTITASSLNLRQGPGIDHDIVTSLPRGTRVSIYEINPNGWYRIEDPNSGDYLWVAGNYVRQTREMRPKLIKRYRRDCCLSERW